jgi:hypothetical protein
MNNVWKRPEGMTKRRWARYIKAMVYVLEQLNKSSDITRSKLVEVASKANANDGAIVSQLIAIGSVNRLVDHGMVVYERSCGCKNNRLMFITNRGIREMARANRRAGLRRVLAALAVATACGVIAFLIGYLQ